MGKFMESLKKRKIFSILPSLRLQDSKQKTDYSKYYFTLKEIILYVSEGLAVTMLFAYVFFRSWIAFVILLPLVLIILKKKQMECCSRRKQTLALQFRELMSSVIAGLHAGYSIENSFVNGYKDMILLFGKKSLIVKELGYITKNLRNNRNLEDLLLEFGERSHVDDIRDFAEIFKIAKRNGGDLPAMIRQTADVISDKIEVRSRIATVVSSKKMEQSIMNFVPFGIILYIDASSPGFFDALYHNITGIAIMCAMTVLYLIAYMLAEKITDIKV